MKITGINGFMPKMPGIGETKKPVDNKFGNVMVDFVKQVNSDQVKSNEMTRDYIDGKDVELHEVMIAGEKAKTNLELLMEIRNKAIDMYKELSRM